MRSPLRRVSLASLFLVLLPLTAAAGVRQRGALAAAVLERFGAHAFEEVSLALPAGAPERWSIEVPVNGERETLLFSRHDLRAPGALVRVHRPDGRVVEEAPPAPRTYRGSVLGRPSTTVLASIGERGLTVDVYGHPAGDWSVRPQARLDARLSRARHVVFSAADASLPPLACGADELHPVEARASGGTRLGPFVNLEPFTPCLQRAQIAFDADYEYFLAQGGTTAGTIGRIDAHMNQVDFFYARDVKITYAITGYVVRTAPFYTPTSGGDLLDQFRLEWQANQSPVLEYDVAHLMTDKPGSIIEYGGLAYVGVVCSQAFGYGWSLDSAGIIGHEVGHNWNAPHCLDPTPCNAMCGACLSIGPNTKGVIEAHRDSRSCLEVVPPYATNVPPYAAPDRVDVRKNELPGLTAVPFDVLANDEDGNCEPVALGSFQGVSDLGGAVVLSPGTGPGGRDRLAYTPPPGLFLGEDAFTYDVIDGSGGVTTGTAVFEVEPLTLDGYWKLDETGGTVAFDDAGSFDGDYLGTPVLGAAAATSFSGSGVEFEGAPDRVRIPALELASNRVTIAAWVRRSGDQAPFAGIAFCRDGTTAAGLRFGADNELRYGWDDDPAVDAFDSGLVLPDGVWQLVAVVVEPDRATLYRGDGGGLSSAVHVHPHAAEAFDGLLTLARDPLPGRYFVGDLDDVRVYDYALSAQEVEGLLAGGAAYAPLPADGEKLPDPTSALGWTPGTGGGTHDLYLGTDSVQVAAATTASPEYVGNVAGTSYVPAGLADGVTYFWRVDEVVGPDVVQGPLWQFELAERYRWRLDETSGTVAAESENGADGTYVNGPTLGVAGATPSLGTAVSFDGTNDRVRLPALNLNTNRLTITGWFKRSGSQSSFAGLVFSRDGSTTAGLNLGSADELRYHWNNDGGSWGWDSGLVLPDGAWVFAALVVEPTRATMYMGQGGALSSSVNVLNHAIEEFDGFTMIARDQTGGRLFRGEVDDVRIFDAALTPAQVDDLYQGSL